MNTIEHLTVRQAARTYFGGEEAKSFLDKLRITGGGPPFMKAGKKVLYRSVDIEKWLADRTYKNTTEAQRKGIK